LPRLSSTAGRGRHEIHLADAVTYLRRYPFTSQRKAVALVRAARLYAQAIWLADEDPEFAWLSLIAACEVAAGETFGSYDPKSTRKKRASVVWATQRFRKFVTQYAASPPVQRPDVGLLDWARMDEHADWIYHWRSRLLHEGIPFPPPMLEPPRAYGDNGIESETPLGLATSTGSSSWKAEHTPMLLHTFAFICRQALLRWWERTPMPRLHGAAVRSRQGNDLRDSPAE
jgi:hypothetical protein